MQERLQKIIARAGIASRRHAEELISSGQVRVNGEVVTELGSKADPETDRVEVAGKAAEIPSEPSYYMLHKPVHVVSTMSDPEGRATLRHLLRGLSEGIFPVGRLDYAASGLLLLTNDGELANRIFKNSSSMPKVYWIKVKGRPSPDLLANIRHSAHAHLRLLDPPGAAKKDADNPWYEVELAEARRDLLRRALFAADHPVEKLKRVKLGPLDLGDLPEAHYRKLDPSEVSRLRQAIDRAEKAPHPVRPVGKRKDPGNRRYKRLREAPGLNRANSAAQASPPQPPTHRPFQKPFREPFSNPFGEREEGRPSASSGNRPFRKSLSKPSGKPRGGRPSTPQGNRPFRKPFDKSFGKPGESRSSNPHGDRPFRKLFSKSFDKADKSRPSASSGNRAFRKPFSKPFGKPAGGRPSAPPGDRPFRKPFGKPGESRPSNPRGDRPFRKPFSKPFGRAGEGRPSVPPGNRPFRKPFGKPFDKSSRKPDAGAPSARPPFGGKPFRKPFRKSFTKPGGDSQGRPSQ